MRSFFTCLLIFVSACGPDAETGSKVINGRTMGTTYSVQIPSISSTEREKISAEIESALDSVNASMSTYLADSAISRFNRSRSTDWQTVPASLAVVTSSALQLSQQSDGAFDATVSPLLRIWGFGSDVKEDESLPSTTEIADALRITGHARLKVRLSPPALMKQVAELQIDLSAIAKGFAVDTIASIVQTRGYENYLVEIGGELRVSGSNEAGQPWSIGIENPAANSPLQRLDLVDGGIATSGDYRNFRVQSGRRYSHIIDPRSGVPISHDLASVTVIHKNAMLADGWSTALMVLGPEDGLALANTQELAALFIVRTDNGFLTRQSRSFLPSQSH